MAEALAQPGSRTAENAFQTDKVLAVSVGHGLHDSFTGFMPVLLPLLRDQFSLSLSQVGVLAGLTSLPSILNPLIGHLDDRHNLRLAFIFAPAVTATAITAVGLLPNFPALVVWLLLAGLSVAVLHAVGPVFVASISGRKTGQGMSFFMAFGELGRTIGPLIAGWAAGALTLRGLLPVSLVAWGMSFLMFISLRPSISRTRRVPSAAPDKPAPTGYALSSFVRFFLPLCCISLTRTFLVTVLGAFLPTLFKENPAQLDFLFSGLQLFWPSLERTPAVALSLAGGVLSVYQLAGTLGALAGGTLSDRIGRKRVLGLMMAISTLLTLAYLHFGGWVGLALLLLLGFANLAIQPVLLALVQDYFTQARALANGIYLAFNFLFITLTGMTIGGMGDLLGLQQAFFWCAVISGLGIPFIFLLPQKPPQRSLV